MEQITPAIGQAITKAFKQLLSEKHLYQYAEVDLSCVSSFAKTLHSEDALSDSDPGSIGSHRSTPSLESLISKGEDIAANLWAPEGILWPTPGFSRDTLPLHFNLPTINTFCDHCNERWPFNSVAQGSCLMQGEEGQDESFYLGYQCQQCKRRPILFLVCREGLKLRLAGRYPLQVLPTPKVLPKSVSKYYSNALIAHHAGQTLAGLFLLRAFIEQFWKTIPAVRELFVNQPKVTGDEQGDAYQSVLPQDFKSRFPSLKEIYGSLSAAIHSADENAKLFDDSCAKIVKHFEARQLFEIAN